MKPAAIQTYVLKLTEEHASTNLLYRYKLGAACVDLQKQRKDIGGNGRPAYGPARETVAEWLKKAGYEISENILKHATYIAIRLNVEQIETLARAKMQFSQVYSMLRAFKDNSTRTQCYVQDVAAGKKKDFAKFNRTQIVQPSERRIKEGGIIEFAIRGDEDEEAYSNMVAALASAGRRLYLDVPRIFNEAIERIGK